MGGPLSRVVVGKPSKSRFGGDAGDTKHVSELRVDPSKFFNPNGGGAGEVLSKTIIFKGWPHGWDIGNVTPTSLFG